MRWLLRGCLLFAIPRIAMAGAADPAAARMACLQEFEPSLLLDLFTTTSLRKVFFDDVPEGQAPQRALLTELGARADNRSTHGHFIGTTMVDLADVMLVMGADACADGVSPCDSEGMRDASRLYLSFLAMDPRSPQRGAVALKVQLISLSQRSDQVTPYLDEVGEDLGSLAALLRIEASARTEGVHTIAQYGSLQSPWADVLRFAQLRRANLLLQSGHLAEAMAVAESTSPPTSRNRFSRRWMSMARCFGAGH